MENITQHCRKCEKSFSLRREDLAFYESMDMPKPKECRQCEQQVFDAWRNERNLSHRQCDACNKGIISCFSKEKVFPVYCRECWWSDKWDPLDSGRDFDFTRPFFEQFQELEETTAHFALFQEDSSENCDYCNFGMNSKSCYMSLAGYSEDIYYSYMAILSKNCMDVTKVIQTEQSYDCVDVEASSNLLFSQNCFQCHDSAFLFNSKNSSECFGAVNLNHAQYVFLGQQLTKEDYQTRLKELKWTQKFIKEMQTWLDKEKLKFPQPPQIGAKNENVTGDHITGSHNLHECFDCLDMQDSAYCHYSGKGHHMWNSVNSGAGSSYIYKCSGAVNMNNVAMHLYGRNLSDSRYSQYCFNAKNLFGCIGLNRKEYCIFNKQYSKEDYEALVPLIIEHMKKTEEWGDFFPMERSPFAYNESRAQDIRPLTQKQVEDMACRWKKYEVKSQSYIGPHIQIPDSIDEVSSSITKEILHCEVTGDLYKIIPQELAFYRKKGLPIPRRSPNQRHLDRMARRNPRQLFERQCNCTNESHEHKGNHKYLDSSCMKKIQTSYAPTRPEKVYCEACYLKTVY
jgi:hypothetical protein